MEKSTLIDMLKSLSPKEMKELDDYLHSPFFNKNQSVRKLFRHLRKYHPDFNSPELEKELVHKKIFSGAEYNDDFMRQVIFSLAKQIEGYLVQVYMSDSPWEQERILVFMLSHKRLDRLFKKNLDKAFATLDKIKQRPSEWYYRRFFLEREKASHLQRLSMSNVNKFFKNMDITGMRDNLTSYYLITILRLKNFFLGYKSIHGIDDDLVVLETIIDSLDKELLEKTPLIEVYFNMVKLGMTSDVKYYNNLKDRLDFYEGKVDVIEFQNILTVLYNFALKNYNSGGKIDLEEVFSVRKLVIDRDAYHIHDEYIHPTVFRQLVELGMELGHDEWIDKLIKDFKDKLYPDTAESILLYSASIKEFYNGNYDNALESAAKIKPMDALFKKDLKILNTKIYYELGFEDLYISNLDTFRHFLDKDNYLSDTVKEEHMSFIRLARRLYRLKINPNKNNFDKFTEAFQKEKSIAHRFWFERKAIEFGKKTGGK